jgi:hypothetical protein
MRMQTLHYRFMRAYDAFVQDIFNYFFARTLHREQAKILTQETFSKTWEELSQASPHISGAFELRQIHKLLRKNAEAISMRQNLSFAL